MESARQFHIDVDRYTRTNGLFDAKRGVLPPEAIERLAREVVMQLAATRLRGNEAHITAPEPEIDPKRVGAFCDVLLHQDAAAALRFLQEELAPVVPERAALYAYIAAVSRLLGDRWDADQVTFVQVTVSVGKLYALVRSIGAGREARVIGQDPRRVALFASVPGEQHTLGVTIAAELFREAGWQIDLQVARSHDELLARANETRPSVVGISLSNKAGLAPLARLVVALRLALPGILIAVAGGADADADMLRNLVDLDLVITHASQAQADLDRLLHPQTGA
jgi:MerR family transcriptional regulator, light-induced transcriptional regulator